MRKKLTFKINNPKDFKTKFIFWSAKYKYISILDSNDYYKNYKSDFSYNTYDFIAGTGKISAFVNNKNTFDKLNKYKNKTKDWLFGYFAYDLKNKIENLESNNIDNLNFNDILFFQPEFVFILKQNTLEIHYLPNKTNKNTITDIFNKITNQKTNNKLTKLNIDIKQRVTKNNYIKTINKLKKHIKKGDIYEINYCIEFYDNKSKINPYKTYNHLITKSPTPFSAFLKIGSRFLISASPERFIKKQKNKIISQPIKGTIKKTDNQQQNNKLKKQLYNDEKERSENVMIVDLVRNDLSITAKKASVKVEELFGIYEFPQVFQMISTVVSEKSDKFTSVDVIKNAFPMGSMTGAPKIKAMELIEKYETTKRGLYSGAVGYFSPNDNFDFNVVIRSILYNRKNKYLSFIVGGAITDKSIPENEYNECLLKAKAIFEVLNIQKSDS